MRDDPSILLMLFELKSSESFGFVPPMGSGRRNNQGTEEPPLIEPNLNAGRGDP